MAGAVPGAGLRFGAESADLEPDLEGSPAGNHLAPFNGRGHPTLHPNQFANDDS
jgi:hypothetical protein